MRSFLVASSALAAALLPAGAAAALAASDIAEYEAFRQKYGRSKDQDAVSYEERVALYVKRKAEVDAHNSQPGVLWKAKVNEFADYTEDERQALLGYRRLGKWWEGRDFSGGAGRSFLELRPGKLAEAVDYRHSLNSSHFLRQQGACGSCWAVAAVGALEMHAELRGQQSRPLSYQQLVDCVPNPQHCGGDGGCKGATAELAFEYVENHGLADAQSYKSDGFSKCGSPQPATKISAWERLPTNKLRPLMETVANKGPVVVSVDASGWSSYDSGIFNGCSRDATVNHAVLLVGYGTDEATGKKYWTIRNSWGASWGEAGFIRLQRHESDEGEDGYCGTDYDPKQGVGCDGGPKTIPVCGMCGVLSDSSYPKEVDLKGPAPSSLLDASFEHELEEELESETY